MIFREGEDVVGGGVSHVLVVGGRGPEEADHLLHLGRWQRGGCHRPWQERGADLPGSLNPNDLVTMQILMITMTMKMKMTTMTMALREA